MDFLGVNQLLQEIILKVRFKITINNEQRKLQAGAGLFEMV
jgi:hypothetical protein